MYQQGERERGREGGREKHARSRFLLQKGQARQQGARKGRRRPHPIVCICTRGCLAIVFVRSLSHSLALKLCFTITRKRTSKARLAFPSLSLSLSLFSVYHPPIPFGVVIIIINVVISPRAHLAHDTYTHTHLHSHTYTFTHTYARVKTSNHTNKSIHLKHSKTFRIITPLLTTPNVLAIRAPDGIRH